MFLKKILSVHFNNRDEIKIKINLRASHTYQTNQSLSNTLSKKKDNPAATLTPLNLFLYIFLA